MTWGGSIANVVISGLLLFSSDRWDGYRTATVQHFRYYLFIYLFFLVLYSCSFVLLGTTDLPHQLHPANGRHSANYVLYLGWYQEKSFMELRR
jgi:hypothetical protein